MVSYQDGRVVLGAIMHGSHTPLIDIAGTQAENIYIENVIRRVVLPRRAEFRTNFIFMDGNACLYRTRRILNVLNEI